MRRHVLALAEATPRPLALYNIPYRTGVNLANETLFHVAEQPNIVGVKDCCGDAAQSFDLLRLRPPGFAVLTGEDALFFTALSHGADGGILAAAHIDPSGFAALRRDLLAGQREAALARWGELVDVARLLFAEPNPAAIKHSLWRAGPTASPHPPPPITRVTPGLPGKL